MYLKSKGALRGSEHVEDEKGVDPDEIHWLCLELSICGVNRRLWRLGVQIANAG